MADTMKTSGQSWQMGKSLLECHQYMFDHQISCDVRIQFSASGSVLEEIGAHKYILMCRSPVFEAMLTGEFVKDVGSTVTIDIPDVDPSIFKEVIRYMYFDGATIVAQTVLPILHNAKKYLLDGLARLCTTYLEGNMSVTNACTLLNTCAFEEVVELCLQYMRSHPASVLTSPGFLGLNKDGLHRLLKSDLAYDQKEVFDACIRWAKHQQDQDKEKQKVERTLRDILGKCLYHLGFLSMTSAELAVLTRDVPLLSDAEQLALYRHAAMPDDEMAAALGTFGFTEIPAILTTRSWFDRIDLEKGSFGGHHGDDIRSSLCFSVDKGISFRGIGVFGTEKTSRYSIAMDLFRNSTVNGPVKNEDSLCRFDGRMWSLGGRDPIRIVMPTAVQLTPGVEYRIQMVLSNIRKSIGHMYRGLGQAEKVNCGQCTFTLSSSGSQNNGLIAHILYAPK